MFFFVNFHYSLSTRGMWFCHVLAMCFYRPTRIMCTSRQYFSYRFYSTAKRCAFYLYPHPFYSSSRIICKTNFTRISCEWHKNPYRLIVKKCKPQLWWYAGKPCMQNSKNHCLALHDLIHHISNQQPECNHTRKLLHVNCLATSK